RILVLAWDIETYNSRKTGKMPNSKYDEDKVFMICMTVNWKDDPELLKRICLVNRHLALDIQIGFNDSQYDWKFIVEKANKLGILKWMFNYMSFNCIAIDVWPYFMGFSSKKEKSSLTYYLKECNFDNKVDLPIHCMNKYYEMALKETNATMAEQMRKIAEFYIINAFSCQQLIIKRNIINEYKTVANIAFISLFNMHYFAIGMKVSNLLSVSTWRKGILTSTILEKMEIESFLDTYVFPSIKRLKNKCPVTGLDFVSLYLSLIMTYNLSPDKIILSRKHAESLRGGGKRLHKINFKFNDNDVFA
ncbi:17048_t:CDS:2, partial [Funneliformis geosporum]